MTAVGFRLVTPSIEVDGWELDLRDESKRIELLWEGSKGRMRGVPAYLVSWSTKPAMDTSIGPGSMSVRTRPGVANLACIPRNASKVNSMTGSS